jgi:DMSO/TMAO reductase YedYZ molybdopterin-dependent catalytic subunit
VPGEDPKDKETEGDIEVYILQKGKSKKSFTTTLKDIKKLPKEVFPVTMACDGNRRREVNRVRKSDGFDWGIGAVSTANWGGVLLREFLLAHFEIAYVAEFSFVCFESFDHPPKGAYGTSLPLARVLDSTSDVLLAYEMNGEDIPYDHGYPIRTILPGCVGGRTVKWLKKIFLSDEPSSNWYHLHDNRFITNEKRTVPHDTNKDKDKDKDMDKEKDKDTNKDKDKEKDKEKDKDTNKEKDKDKDKDKENDKDTNKEKDKDTNKDKDKEKDKEKDKDTYKEKDKDKDSKMDRYKEK